MILERNSNWVMEKMGNISQKKKHNNISFHICTHASCTKCGWMQIQLNENKYSDKFEWLNHLFWNYCLFAVSILFDWNAFFFVFLIFNWNWLQFGRRCIHFLFAKNYLKCRRCIYDKRSTIILTERSHSKKGGERNRK